MQPQIIAAYSDGEHNKTLGKTVARLEKSAMHRDLSTVIVFPAHKDIPPRIVLSWMNLFAPPNQTVGRLAATGQEVGEAYSNLLVQLLDNPQVPKFKYLLTIEHDNSPPQDGLVQLLEDMEDHPELNAVGGLYFTKGEGGVAQIWGNPNEHPVNFRPQVPKANCVQECCGTGMGFTLFRMSMFKDKRLRKPWFKTTTPGNGTGGFTQDLYFWHDARQYGHRCAVDTRVKVGHLDLTTGIMW